MKTKLNAKGISNIPQGVAKRKFAFEDYFISQEKGYISSAVKRNKNLRENLNKAGFLVGD